MPRDEIEKMCPVCGAITDTYRDDGEGTNLEYTEDCVIGCGLYHYQHAYGAYQQQIGFGGMEWSYRNEESGDDDWHLMMQRFREFALRETRLMWNNPELQPFLRAYAEKGCDYDLRPLRDRITELEWELKLPYSVDGIDRRIAEEITRAGH